MFDAVADVHLTDRAEPLLVGRLAQHGHEIYFEYDPEFLATGLELSPLGLPLREGIQQEPERIFRGLHGVFADSLPDGWGLRLMDRAFAQRGIDPATVTPVDRLKAVGKRAMGALTYQPAVDDAAAARVDLEQLAEQSERIYAGSPEDVLPALVQAGGSAAGARPKALVAYNPSTHEMLSGAADIPPGYVPYLVKFPTPDDDPEAGVVEIAYAAMAREAGISMPDARLFETSTGRRCFGVERFDRVLSTETGAVTERRHAHTLGGLCHVSHREHGATYGNYLDATRHLTRDYRAVVQAYRRMVFNVLAHNRDDHVKNMAFLMEPDGSWHLSPAYDLMYMEGPQGEHSMMIDTEGARPALTHFLRVAAASSIPGAEARAVVEEVAEAVGKWKAFATAVDLSVTQRKKIGGRLKRVRDEALASS